LRLSIRSSSTTDGSLFNIDCNTINNRSSKPSNQLYISIIAAHVDKVRLI